MEYYLLYRCIFFYLVMIIHDHQTDQVLFNLISLTFDNNATNTTVFIQQNGSNKTSSWTIIKTGKFN